MSEQSTTTPTQHLVPFEDMSKEAQIAHLTDYHAVQHLEGRRITKAALERHHAQIHGSHDAAVMNGTWKPAQHYDAGWFTYDATGHIMWWIEHEHHGVEVTPEARAELEALNLDKPLTASEKKALTDLINNDFATLRREIELFGRDLLVQRRKDAEDDAKAREAGRAEWQAKVDALAVDYTAAREQFMADWRAKREALDEALAADGYGVNRGKYDRDAQVPVKVEVAGLKEALAQIEAETATEQQTAVNTLERERLMALRKVMLAGVPKATLALVEGIPTARELMGKAASNRLAQQAEIAAEAHPTE